MEMFYDEGKWWTADKIEDLSHLPGNDWTVRDNMLASLICMNGLAVALWVASEYVIDLAKMV